mgnify:CR=1 FL=1
MSKPLFELIGVSNTSDLNLDAEISVSTEPKNSHSNS